MDVDGPRERSLKTSETPTQTAPLSLSSFKENSMNQVEPRSVILHIGHQ